MTQASSDRLPSGAAYPALVPATVGKGRITRISTEAAEQVPGVLLAKRGGNKQTVDVREIVNGVMCVLGTGCRWATLPNNLPPRSTVNRYFVLWDHDRTLGRPHGALYVQCRKRAGREADPTVAIIEPRGSPDIDSQSVKSAEEGRISDSPDFDTGKKIKGKKRHILVDTQGLLMATIVHAGNIRDRDGGVLLMASLFGLYPSLLKLYADSAYAGPKFQDGLRRALPEGQSRDRRAHHRLADPVPPPGQGLGAPEPECARLPAVGLNQAHGPEVMPNNEMFVDGPSIRLLASLH